MSIRSGQVIKFRLTNGKIKTAQVIGKKVGNIRLVSNGKRFYNVPENRIIKKV